MTLFPNSGLQRLVLHTAGWTLASTLSSAFSAVFLLRAGLAPAQIFLSFAAILALRFILRPIVLLVAPAVGLRRTFILGAILCAASSPVLALTDGIGPGLAAFVLISASGQVFYCTCYHVFFTALGDSDRRGAQVGAFQALGTLAAVLGPSLGGLLLEGHGAKVTFGVACLVALAAILPLARMPEPKVAQVEARGAYAAAKRGALLYLSDGWIQVGLASAWSIVLFQTLSDRYDSFGETLSLAALAGAVGGMVLGRSIDRGHSRSVVRANAGMLAFVVLLRSLTFGNPAAAVAIAVTTTMVGGFYLPCWMTAVYNDAKRAPCMLRFQFAAEGGWDAGGVLAGVTASAFCALGLPLEAVILLALPAVAMQMGLLNHVYASHRASTGGGGIGATAPGPVGLG